MKETEGFVLPRVRATGAEWIEGFECQIKCGNIRKEISLCPCRISNTVCLIISSLRSHYIHFVISAVEEGGIFKSNLISCTNNRLCLLAASGSITKICGSVCAFKLQ